MSTPKDDDDEEESTSRTDPCNAHDDRLWPEAATLTAWTAEQTRLASLVRESDSPRVAAIVASLDSKLTPWLVGGLDVNWAEAPSSSGRAVAALAVLEAPSLNRVETVVVEHTPGVASTPPPYAPGFLGFRELPAFRKCLARCSRKPDVLLVDGNGVLHPRRCGSACHVGLAENIPTVGVAKELLNVDDLDKRALAPLLAELRAPGDWRPLRGASGRVWGAVVRTTLGSTPKNPKRQRRRKEQYPRDATTSDTASFTPPNADANDGNSSPALAHHASFKPIFVSTGHDVCLETAVRLVLACSRYRIPEPIRQADLLGRGRIV